MDKERYSLNTLLRQLGIINDTHADVYYTGLCLDSRKIKHGDLFIAVRGEAIDGHRFIPSAIEKGAVAIVAEKGQHLSTMYREQCVPVYAVSNLQRQLGNIIKQWFHAPDQQMNTVGITGTNGKTSCSFFLAQALQHLGQTTGVMGTIGKGIYPHLIPFNNTTPGIYEVYECMAAWVQQSVPWTVMEVTSHALCQGRVSGVQFDSALFTNISRDHLDYHKTMNDYVLAKARLFSTPGLKHAIVNADDAYALQMQQAVNASALCLTYSLEKNNADIYLKDIVYSIKGIEAHIITPWGEGRLNTSLFGRFNLYNILGVIGILGCHGFSLNDILHTVSRLGNVPGRMAVYGGEHGQPTVIVDYSHTPDALANALSAIKEQHTEDIVCIFGCGGDRDRGKRPLMMQAALEYANRIVLTHDNPRFENQAQIINDALMAVDGVSYDRVCVIEDRRQAIEQTILQAASTDIILIAGKGHEDYQEIKGVKHPLDDSEEAKRALLKRSLSSNRKEE